MGYTKNNIVKFLVLLPVFVFILLGIGLISQPPDSESFRRSIGPPDLDWVDKTLRSLTLREQIGQLIHVRIRGEFLNRESRDYTNLIRDIEDYKVGGMVLFAGNIYESVHLINDLQQRSDLPLLVASDFERGASFRIEDTTSFPWAMAVGATESEEYAYSQGMITAREARALGVHWIFAPVLDVNNNPENPVINIRAYGEDPVLVAGLGTAFIRG
ncbi:MAG: glycoside hydrolase family 3 N-terminal domain-containing protein, partial [Acidobacteriota bacterium]